MSIKTSTMWVRLEEDLRDAVNRGAREFELSQSEYVRLALRNQAKRDGVIEERREPAKV